MESKAGEIAHRIRHWMDEDTNDETAFLKDAEADAASLYPNDCVTRDADATIDVGSAIFTLVFEGKEYDVSIVPAEPSF